VSLLTLLEKEMSFRRRLRRPDGKPTRRWRMNAACILIDDGSYGDRGRFYSYYDGQVLMGLSVYLEHGRSR
jgi:hypothetical protein